MGRRTTNSLVGFMEEFILQTIRLPVPFLVMFGIGLCLWRKPAWSQRILGVTALALIVASLPAMGKLLMWPQLMTVPQWRPGPGDPMPAAVLVPTGGIFYALDVGWWPSDSSVERLGKALAVQAELKAAGRAEVPLLVVGGTGNPPPAPAEADILLRRYPDVPASTIVETKALNTAETALAVRRILGQERESADTPVVVVTDEYHAARMAASLRASRIVPLLRSTREAALYGIAWNDFVPSARGFDMTSHAIHSWAGLAWYLATDQFTLDDLLWGNPASDSPKF
jgi:uncharacterized SAM-binding protein YcdF (DUF218 family)